LRADILLALLCPGAALPQVHHDVIRADVQFQLIENFGASDAWRIQKIGAWSLANRARVADLLFSQDKGIGLSCWRFNIGGGINPRITLPWRAPSKRSKSRKSAEFRNSWPSSSAHRPDDSKRPDLHGSRPAHLESEGRL
jgi:hypothetical protein